jgi:lipoprotein-releasing system permease protein
LISQLEKKIILRYLKPQRKEGFLKIISLFSFLGIALGVAVLIIVMSVMNGFRSELTNKILGFNPHVVVKPYGNTIDQKKINSDELKSLSKNVVFSNNGEGVIIYKNNTKGILIRGYNKNDFINLDFIKNSEIEGNSNILINNNISIGKDLSLIFNLSIGDKILIMSPQGISTIIGNLPKQEIFTITSIFNSGLSEFDQNVLFMNIEKLENLFDLDIKNRFLEIYLKNPNNIEKTKIKFEKFFQDEFVFTWADTNSSLFTALKVERNVMFIILTLIIIVAAFNIISGLTILVKNKTREIAILKSIGVLNKSIIKIFFMVGFIIGSTATLFGIFLGILFSIYIENIREFLSLIFNLTLFPEEIYFLSKMPSEINILSILIIALSSISVTILVSIFPAIKASKLDPIKALKYE